MITAPDPRTKRPDDYKNLAFENPKPPSRLYLPFNCSLPEVTLDKEQGTIFIHGRCLSKDPYVFFMPLINWAKEYVKTPQQITMVIINTDFINTGSLFQLRQFLGILAEVQHKGFEIIIKWFCDKDDSDTYEQIEIIGESINTTIHIEVPK
jgi:hypothetical protein